MKKLLLCAVLALTATAASAQTATRGVIGFYLNPGNTYNGYTCPSANVGPCFVQYGASLPTSGGGGTPGGSDTQLQYNDDGAFGGITGATTDGTTVTLTSPTLITPALGTPASGVATNLTGTAAGLSIGGNAATATSATSATTATNVAGGATGQLVRQTGAGASGFTTATFPATAGTSGNVLTSDGTNWSSAAPALVQTTGTWSPTLTGSSTPGTQAYSVQFGNYVKTGVNVVVSFEVRLSSYTATGNVLLTDLPFTSANTNSGNATPGICSVGFYQGFTFGASTTQISVQIRPNSTTADVWTGGSGASGTAQAFSGLLSNAYLTGTCVYQSAS